MAGKAADKQSDAKQELLLTQDIAQLEQELAEKYYQLGKGIYEAADPKIDEINKLVDHIVESKLKLAGVQGQVACAHCLYMNPRDNGYCGRCGSALDPETK